jgi:hypothetical protein
VVSNPQSTVGELSSLDLMSVSGAPAVKVLYGLALLLVVSASLLWVHGSLFSLAGVEGPL